MILIDKNTKPCNTIYYTSACVFKKIKEQKNVCNIDELYTEITKKYNQNINYESFLYALNFLFLLNKIEYKEQEGISYVN